MNTLTPKQAAILASEIYDLRLDSLADVQETGKLLGPDGMFKIGRRFQGRSGAVFKVLSGFGYIAEGEGRYQGEVLCVTRGTASAADWLSNLNVAVQNGPSRRLVHAGFNDIRKSFAPIRKPHAAWVSWTSQPS